MSPDTKKAIIWSGIISFVIAAYFALHSRANQNSSMLDTSEPSQYQPTSVGGSGAADGNEQPTSPPEISVGGDPIYQSYNYPGNYAPTPQEEHIGNTACSSCSGGCCDSCSSGGSNFSVTLGQLGSSVQASQFNILQGFSAQG